MNDTVQIIPLLNLALAFIPVAAVLVILQRWSLGSGTALYAVGRMLLQLLLIGYVLGYIFAAEGSLLVVAVLSVMLLVSSWIILRPLAEKTPKLYRKALLAMLLGGGSTLILIIVGVLQVEPWHTPRFIIPLAGMIFANSMNTVSLAAERFESERKQGQSYREARHTALKVAMIPVVNSLLAVGIVALPGMMTGQILSGVSPLIAARYQIMVMCMIFGASGLAATGYLLQLRPAAGRAE